MIPPTLTSPYRIACPPPKEPKRFDWKKLQNDLRLFIPICCGLILVFGTLYSASHSADKTEAAKKERWENAPCTDFKDDPITGIPGRCLGYTVITESTNVMHLERCLLVPKPIQVPVRVGCSNLIEVPAGSSVMINPGQISVIYQ